jgi:hypothetical protein
MVGLEDYLHDGETVDAALVRKRLFRGREDLAATGSRIIHAGPRGYSDIQYRYITSISDFYILKWKWGIRGVSFLLIAVICLCISLYVPGVSQDVAGGVDDYTTHFIGQMYSSIVPADLISSAGDLPSDANHLSDDGQSDDNPYAGLFENPVPDAISISSLFDFSSPILSAGDMVSHLTKMIGLIVAALAGSCLLIFVFTAKRTILIGTIAGNRKFYFGNETRAKRQEFVKAVSIHMSESRRKNIAISESLGKRRFFPADRDGKS